MKSNHKFLNIESKSKKMQIEKEINEFEDEKSKKIMELGLSTYYKIRKGNLDESLFGELIYEIKKIDLEIYNRMLDIANIEGHDEHTPICECGYISKNNEKFCPNCGMEIKKDRDFILCEVCASKIDADSKFCVCCGSKVIKKEKFDIKDYEIDDDKYEIDDNDEEIFENETLDNSIKEVKKDILDIEDTGTKEKFFEDTEEEIKIQKIELSKKEELNDDFISDNLYIEPKLNQEETN